MKQYTKNQIERFLLAIDQNLTFQFELVIIGGTAAALGYKVSRYTKDIDTVGDVTKIQAAYEKAVKTTGLKIPLGPAGVEDGPYNYEDRLHVIKIAGLKHLTVKIPEKHDLVLMKVIRSQQHDLETIEEIHRNDPLSSNRLVLLMKTEMSHVHGRKKDLLLNFFAMLELLFGEKALHDAERTLKGWK